MTRLRLALADLHKDQHGGVRAGMLILAVATAFFWLAGGFGITLLEVFERVTRVLPA